MRSYNPQSKTFDLKTITGLFIGYCVGSRGSKFYCPSHTTRVIESDIIVYFKEDTSTSQEPIEIVFNEERIIIPIHVASAPVTGPTIDQNLSVTHDDPTNQVVQKTPNVEVDNGDAPLKKIRERTISSDYVVYLQVYEFIIDDTLDPTTYQEGITIFQSTLLMDAIKDEMSFMSQKEMWDLVELPKSCNPH